VGPQKYCVRWGSGSPHSDRRGFDAAFAILLWPIVNPLTSKPNYQTYTRTKKQREIVFISFLLICSGSLRVGTPDWSRWKSFVAKCFRMSGRI